MSKTLNEMVTEINKALDEYGDIAIQVKDQGGKKYIGYKPQYIIDATNKVIGAENWSYMATNFEYHKYITQKEVKNDVITCVLDITIIIPQDDGPPKTVTSGPQAGGSTVLFGAWGDAKKSAITDALGKCLARFSIGYKAYRGLLKEPAGTKPSKKSTGFDSSASKGAGGFLKPAKTSSPKGFTKPKSNGNGDFKSAKKETKKEDTKTDFSVDMPEIADEDFESLDI